MQSQMASSNKILIVPDNRIDLDMIASTFSLANSLESVGKEVYVYSNENNFPIFFSKIIPPTGIKFLSKNKPNDYVITLKNPSSNVSDVKWEQKGDAISIFISTAEGTFKPTDVNVTVKALDFDSVILLGFSDPSKVDIYPTNQKLFDNPDKVLVVNFTNPNKTKYTKDFTLTSASSLSEIVYRLIMNQKLNINPRIAENILAGIYWKTNSFKYYSNSKHLFEIVADLIDKGAVPENAAKKAINNLKLIETKLICEVLENIKITKEKIAISKVPYVKINNIKLDHIIFKNWNLLPTIEGIKVAFVLVENSKKEVCVYIKSNDKRLHAGEFAKEFKGEGDYIKAKFTTTSSLLDTEARIMMKASVLLTDEGEIERAGNNLKSQFPKRSDEALAQSDNSQDQAKPQHSETISSSQEPKANSIERKGRNQETGVSNTNSQVPKPNPRFTDSPIETQPKSRTTDPAPRTSEPDEYFSIENDYDTPVVAPVIGVDGDPLAPAKETPKPLGLNDNSSSQQNQMFASPLPPAGGQS